MKIMTTLATTMVDATKSTASPFSKARPGPAKQGVPSDAAPFDCTIFSFISSSNLFNNNKMIRNNPAVVGQNGGCQL